MAMDFAPYMRSVGLAPGITLPSGEQSQLQFEEAHRITPMGYSSSAEDVASAALFLAESKAITGTALQVDGGQHLLSSERVAEGHIQLQETLCDDSLNLLLKHPLVLAASVSTA